MGGHNIKANSILYYTLQNALSLAAILWAASTPLYSDHDTGTSLHPQDESAWAIVAGVATGARAQVISDALANRWIRLYDAPAPEAGETISPFAARFELQAHYMVGRADRAVNLMEFITFIEGYSTNGSLHYPAYINDPK
ncbi:Six-hairpin glycosidase [Xylariales sp. AK1849]|nr:Six-hairpin glycosidase [Xylariales sp. AK1849]